MRGLAALLVLLLPLAVASAGETPPIPDFQARYGIYKGPLKIGEASRTLGRDGEGPYYRSVVEPVGIAAWVVNLRLDDFSRIQWVQGRPRPLYYRQRREGRHPRLIEQRYDWRAMTAHSRYNGEPFQIPLTPDAVDQNMYLLALMADLDAGKVPAELHVVEGKKMKTYAIEPLGRRRLDTPWGELDVVGLARRGKKERTTLWCAPRLRHLPVLIVHDGEDGRLEGRLEAVQGLAPLPARGGRDEDWE